MTDKKKAGANASQPVPPTIRNDSATQAHGTQFLDLRKSESERLRVHVRAYRGRTFIDLRTWYVDEDGEYRPSSKGVTIKPEQVPEITRALIVAGQSFDPKEAS